MGAAAGLSPNQTKGHDGNSQEVSERLHMLDDHSNSSGGIWTVTDNNLEMINVDMFVCRKWPGDIRGPFPCILYRLMGIIYVAKYNQEPEAGVGTFCGLSDVTGLFCVFCGVFWKAAGAA